MNRPKSHCPSWAGSSPSCGWSENWPEVRGGTQVSRRAAHTFAAQAVRIHRGRPSPGTVAVFLSSCAAHAHICTISPSMPGHHQVPLFDAVTRDLRKIDPALRIRQFFRPFLDSLLGRCMLQIRKTRSSMSFLFSVSLEYRDADEGE